MQFVSEPTCSLWNECKNELADSISKLNKKALNPFGWITGWPLASWAWQRALSLPVERGLIKRPPFVSIMSWDESATSGPLAHSSGVTDQSRKRPSWLRLLNEGPSKATIWSWTRWESVSFGRVLVSLSLSTPQVGACWIGSQLGKLCSQSGQLLGGTDSLHLDFTFQIPDYRSIMMEDNFHHTLVGSSDLDPSELASQEPIDCIPGV